jgi:hypothetical protein
LILFEKKSVLKKNQILKTLILQKHSDLERSGSKIQILKCKKTKSKLIEEKREKSELGWPNAIAWVCGATPTRSVYRRAHHISQGAGPPPWANTWPTKATKQYGSVTHFTKSQYAEFFFSKVLGSLVWTQNLLDKALKNGRQDHVS